MRLTALDPSDRPRSPTPSGGLGGLGYPSAVDRPLDVSTVDLRVGEAFPPAYSQIDFSADKPVDLDDLPPPYLHALVLAMEDARNAAAVNGDAATTSLGSREIISSPVLLLPAEDMPSNSNTLANFDNSTNSNTEYSERVNWQFHVQCLILVEYDSDAMHTVLFHFIYRETTNTVVR